jgi:ribA/ribD-fused uncharacterized protein
MASKTDNHGPIYFWQADHPEWGWLSQWYERDFHGEDDKMVYNTAEQWVCPSACSISAEINQITTRYMMHQKAVFFEDNEIAEKIMRTRVPSEQKALGREVKNFNDKKWYQAREHVVENGSYHKFKHDEEMKAMLLETGDRELVEASPFDKIWGIGFDEKHAERTRKHWGLNLLGKALTRARQRIREEEEKELTL